MKLLMIVSVDMNHHAIHQLMHIHVHKVNVKQNVYAKKDLFAIGVVYVNQLVKFATVLMANTTKLMVIHHVRIHVKRKLYIVIKTNIIMSQDVTVILIIIVIFMANVFHSTNVH